MPFISTTTTPLDRPIDPTRRTGVVKIFKQAIPRFILDEYPLFVEFLEAYYEWLDQYGNPIEFLQNGNKNFDIDTTIDDFMQHFKSAYLDEFPKNLQIHENSKLDERILIKNIREFYNTKGSEKSIQLLFKIIADSDTTIEYPRDYIFVLSSGNYKDYHQIFVLKDYTNISEGFDINTLKGLQLNQYEGLTVLVASATIESIHETACDGKQYYVFLVSNPSGTFVQSDFSPLEIVQNNKTYFHYAVPSVSNLKVVSGGSDYNVGEFFTVGNTAQQHIRGFVSETNENGKIIRVRLFSNPVNYNGLDTIVVDSPFGTGAAFAIETSIISNPVQEYSDNKNLLSKVSKIQDSFEYQQFSYVIKSKRALEEYTEAVKKIIHPSGFVMFNALYNNIESSRTTEYKTRAKVYEYSVLGSYAMYKPEDTSGAGTTAVYNITYFGDTNQTKKWGSIFFYWIPGSVDVNPNTATQQCCTGGQYYGEFAPGGLTFGPPVGGVQQIYLPNRDQSQIAGVTHWIKFPHPSTRGLTAIPAGTSFGRIKLQDMLQLNVPNIL